MRKLILIFCGVFCCLTALHAKDPALYLYQVDALDKVFKDPERSRARRPVGSDM